MRPAARLLLLEADALCAILDRTPAAAFDRPTVCAGWSVRDVLAHCGAALTAAASGDLHRFTPEDNQRDVDERKGWPVADVISELKDGYRAAAVAVDAAGGPLDGIALGEWVHGGDVREALGEEGAYASAGIDIALDLLFDRSARAEKPPLAVHLGGKIRHFGAAGEPAGELRTDIETFVRLCGGRRPDPGRYRLTGAAPADLVLFS